jgi:hypothetical protein
VYDIPA